MPGHWTRSGSTATFTPARAYPPSTQIVVQAKRTSGPGRKTVLKASTPDGSMRRAQQILARLHYLPLTTRAATPTTQAAEAAAVFSPPKGGFSWRYGDTPSGIKSQFSPGKYGIVTRGAIIAFQHQNGLPLDGVLGPQDLEGAGEGRPGRQARTPRPTATSPRTCTCRRACPSGSTARPC